MESARVTRMQTVPSSGQNTAAQQFRRMTEALALSRGCCGYADTELLSNDTWVLLTLEDVARGGSIHLQPGATVEGKFARKFGGKMCPHDETC